MNTPLRPWFSSVTLLCAIAATSACQVEERKGEPSSWQGSGIACQDDLDCPSGELCTKEVCVAPSVGNNGGNGNGTINDPAPDAGPACVLDAECGPGYLCNGGACQPQSGGNASTGSGSTGCTLDTDCGVAEKCINSTCTLDNTGGSGGAGGSGPGGPYCTTDTDCGAGEKCYNGSCIPDDGT